MNNELSKVIRTITKFCGVGRARLLSVAICSAKLTTSRLPDVTSDAGTSRCSSATPPDVINNKSNDNKQTIKTLTDANACHFHNTRWYTFNGYICLLMLCWLWTQFHIAK